MSAYKIKKFKTFEDAERDLWIIKPDKDYFRRVFGFLDEFFLRFIKKFPRGIYKYKTFEEAEKHRLKWLLND